MHGIIEDYTIASAWCKTTLIHNCVEGAGTKGIIFLMHLGFNIQIFNRIYHQTQPEECLKLFKKTPNFVT